MTLQQLMDALREDGELADRGDVLTALERLQGYDLVAEVEGDYLATPKALLTAKSLAQMN